MARYATTRWSLVRQAGESGPAAPKALAELLVLYEPAIRGQLSRWHVEGADCDDLFQEFVARLLEDGTLRRAEAGRGSFRAFLGTALHRFAANQVRDRVAEKRGGKAARDDESALDAVACADAMPDEQFDADWARLVLQRATAALRAEAVARGKGELFEALEGFLAEDARRDDYARIGERFGATANALGVAVHRLRARWRELVRAQVLDTVDDEAGLERELARLREALRG